MIAGKVSAVIPAAGSGLRMGGVSKQLLEICGKTVIEYTVDAFEKAMDVCEIIVCAKADEVEKIKAVLCAFGKVKAVIVGGATRRESVEKALPLCAGEYISIHDGDRPLILTKDIDYIIDQAKLCGAVCAASPITDTVKRSDENGYIEKTVLRDMLYGAQTPQIFKTSEYIEASRRFRENFTDDSSLMEASGVNVKLVTLSGINIKLTTKGDLEIADAIIKKRVEEGIYGL